MADEQYGWLDSDAAERLLRGEPLDAVDADTRARASRLAEALAALAGTPPPAGAELPGEAAALAAFRAARTGRNREEAGLGPHREEAGPRRTARPHSAARPADAGLVHLGPPAVRERRARWARPVRFGLAAALAAGMIGGVAAAAGTGALPTPFDDKPAPAATVVTSQQPPLTPTPGGWSPSRGGMTGSPAQGGSSPAAGNGSAATSRPGFPDNGSASRTGKGWRALQSSCRNLAKGNELGAERLRSLEDAAGGGGRVKAFCRSILNGGKGGGGAGSGDDEGSGQDKEGHRRSGNGNGNGEGDQRGSGGDGEGHIRPGGDGVAATPSAAHGAPSRVRPRDMTSQARRTAR